MKRLKRLFAKDGKTVVVAMDHGMGLSVNPALDDTEKILRAIVAGGADAILTTFGVAKRYADILEDIGLILRVDGGTSMLGDGSCGPQLLYTVEEALKLGADAVACMGFPGTEFEAQTMINLAELAAEGKTWGVPVMAEMLPGGFTGSHPYSVDNLVLTARTGCDYGADIIKTSYAGPPEDFARVVAASYQPVVVLGGEKAKDLTSLFTVIEEACSVGAAGVAIGRNVWKHESPERVTRALVELVHEGKKAADIRL